MPKCDRCTRLEKALRRMLSASMEIAHNSYSVGGKLTDQLWKDADPIGYRDWEKGMEVLDQ